MKTVNMGEWVQFSTRGLTKSYTTKDGKWMMKCTENSAENLKAFEEERDMARLAAKFGVPTPAVDDVVKLPNGSIGLIFQNLPNKRSFSRAVSQEPDRYEEFMEMFAEAAKKLHSCDADPALLPSAEERMNVGIECTPLFSETEKERIREKVAQIPKGIKCLHGDFQFSNAVMSDSGVHIIDIGLMSYGNPLLDIGFLYHMVRFCKDELSDQLFHIDSAMLHKCWRAFIKYYFNDDNIEKIEKMLLPFAGLGSLVILPTVPEADTVNAAREEILG